MKISQVRKLARELIRDAIKSPYWESCQDNEGNPVESLYLGSVLNLYPSGKYYMPWATSNVTPCESCQGTGKSKKYHSCQYCKGIGTRSIRDIAIIRFGENFTLDQYVHLDKNLHKDDQLTWVDDSHFQCHGCQGLGKSQGDCKYCNGIGSREVYEDQCFSEELESAASKNHCYLESGEGDALDLYLMRENKNPPEDDFMED